MFYHFCFVVSDECTRSTHHTSSGSSSMIMITMRLLIDQVHHLSNYCQDNYLESSVLFLPPIFWKTKATTNAALMKKVGDNGPITIPTTANGWVSVGTSRSELKCPMPIRAIPLNYPPPLCCQMAQNYGGIIHNFTSGYHYVLDRNTLRLERKGHWLSWRMWHSVMINIFIGDTRSGILMISNES